MKRGSGAVLGLARWGLCAMQLALFGWVGERGWMMKQTWIVWALAGAMPWWTHELAPVVASTPVSAVVRPASAHGVVKSAARHRIDRDIRLGACIPRYCIVTIVLEPGEPARLHLVELNERGGFARLYPVTTYGRTMREARFVGKDAVRLYVRSINGKGVLAHQLFDLNEKGLQHAMASRVLRGDRAISENGDQEALERAIELGHAPRLLV
ncbi:TPA: hypothetical protein QDC03_006204 [Burkholderia cepacia]|nr:hypothetical protein [Burkholderia cepacia]HDR9511015.1 hypothetical protein [Burkholderia cepacia]